MWTAEQAKNYENHIDNLLAARERKAGRAASIKEGSRILVKNNRWQGRKVEQPTWHRVEKVTRYSDGILEIVTTDGRTLGENDLILVETNMERTETFLISISDRADEFRAALQRAKDNRLEVYPDFEKDNFVVVNLTQKSEYRVHIFGKNLGVFANCECRDFSQRSRVCKHISEVVKFAFSGLAEKLQKPQIGRFYASFEAGNFKRQHENKSASFETLEEAIGFVEKGIGSLQGQGSVSDGTETVWTYQPEWAEEQWY